MELEKLSKRIEKLSSNLEQAFLKDINFVINTVFEEYDIYYKGTNESVKKQNFINKFRILFSTVNEEIICNGLSKNGNKCTKKATENSKYCKTHSYLSFRDSQYQPETETLFLVERNDITEEIKENLTLKFIEDTFYYIDDSFIYDKDSLQKVGYISNNQFILTEDPFIIASRLN